MSTTIRPTTSAGENVPEIQVLEERVRALGQSADFWNDKMVWALVLAAIAAVFVMLATVMALRRAGQKDEAQSELIRSKDRKLALELRDKDLGIAEAKKVADEAKARGAVAERHAAVANLRAEKERLERMKLEEDLSPRLFNSQEKAIERLRAFAGTPVTLEYLIDLECKRTAEQIAWVLRGAGWVITPKPNSALNSIIGEGVTVTANLLGPSAGAALIDELNKTGIDAERPPGAQPRDGTPVVIHVGMKPSPEQKKLLKYIRAMERQTVDRIQGRKVSHAHLAESFDKALGPGESGNRSILPDH